MNKKKFDQGNRSFIKKRTKKLTLTALFSCLGFVLSTFVYFPQMAPFQHFVNVLCAVFLGPWYGMLAAFLTGSLRMLTGRTILSITGALFGAFLSGWLYRRFEKFYWAVIGEIIGTGIISALVSYPVMKYIFGLDLISPFFYIPFFIPSAIMGAILAYFVLVSLKRSGMLDRLLERLEE